MVCATSDSAALISLAVCHRRSGSRWSAVMTIASSSGGTWRFPRDSDGIGISRSRVNVSNSLRPRNRG
jgi:hypothetical protein